MKIALTGASGHLGSSIIPALIKRDYKVKALINKSQLHFTEFNIEVIKGDLLNPQTLRELMKGCDALIHCAAVISINGDPTGMVHKTNVEGTKLVMDIAKQSGIKRVVHVSSIHAYNQQTGSEILNEQSPLADEKAYAYDRSKKAGQEIALAMNTKGMEVIVVNPTSIVGPYDFKPSRMGKVIIDLYKGRLPFVFAGGFDFCDSRDVANATVNALTQGKPGENYLLAGKWQSFTNLVNMLSKASGNKINVINLPPSFGILGLPFIKALSWINKKEPLYTTEALDAICKGNKNISSLKAIQELGYTIRPFEETIADTFNWFKQKCYLV